MKPGQNHRGALLLEILIALMLALLVGAALAAMLRITYTMSRFSIGQNSVTTQARSQVDMLADHLRNAQSYSNGAVKEVFAAASASDLTVYLNSSGDTLRFWLDTSATPPAFRQSRKVAGVTTTTTLLSDVTALQFTYYQQAQTSYTAALNGWTTTANAHVPTSFEWPNIGAVSISLTVTNNGYSNQINSFVRLRNSPYQ